MRTNYGFRRLFRVWGLDHTFTLRVCRLVSTPSSIEKRMKRSSIQAWLGINMRAAPNIFGASSEAFPEFDKFYMQSVGERMPTHKSRATQMNRP